jgi:hypothetical protein
VPSKFKIKVARIEAAAGSRTVCITFQIERGAVHFQVPIRLSISDYDDTEMVRAARSTLHRAFVELAAQSQDWKLSAKDMQQLSSMSLRPNARKSERTGTDGARPRAPTSPAKSAKYRRRAP